MGRWYGEHMTAMRPRIAPGSTWNGEILWDSYLLYTGEATWDEAPTGLVHWGRTIVAGRETLRQDLRIQAYEDQRFATAGDRRQDVIAEWTAGLRRRGDIIDLYLAGR